MPPFQFPPIPPDSPGPMGGMSPPSGAMPIPGMPGTPPGPPGLDQTALIALSALDQLAPREASGAAALDRVKKALELAQKLIVTSLPQVSQWNAKMAKDLHVIGRQLADARINIEKSEEPGPPPEDLISGIGSTGLPGRML